MVSGCYEYLTKYICDMVLTEFKSQLSVLNQHFKYLVNRFTGIIPFSCPRMFSGESCLRCRVCFVCFEGWFFERIIKNIMPVYC